MREEPFFQKSKEKFTTSTIEAWWMLTKHLRALQMMRETDITKGKKRKLYGYMNYLERTIFELEKVPCLQIVQEETPRKTFKILKDFHWIYSSK